MPGSARAVHRGRVDSRNSRAKIRQAKGAAPRFSASYAPSRYWKAPGPKSTANNERLAIASLFPRPKGSIRHTRVACATSFSPRAIPATARASNSMSMEAEVIFDRPQAAFPQPRDASSDELRCGVLSERQLWSISTKLGYPRYVRFTPASDRAADVRDRQLRVTSEQTYWINSSNHLSAIGSYSNFRPPREGMR